MGTASEGEPNRFPATCLVALSTYFVTAAWERVLWPRGSRRAREAFIQQVHVPAPPLKSGFPAPAHSAIVWAVLRSYACLPGPQRPLPAVLVVDTVV